MREGGGGKRERRATVGFEKKIMDGAGRAKKRGG